MEHTQKIGLSPNPLLSLLLQTSPVQPSILSCLNRNRTRLLANSAQFPKPILQLQYETDCSPRIATPGNELAGTQRVRQPLVHHRLASLHPFFFTMMANVSVDNVSNSVAVLVTECVSSLAFLDPFCIVAHETHVLAIGARRVSTLFPLLLCDESSTTWLNPHPKYMKSLWCTCTSGPN